MACFGVCLRYPVVFMADNPNAQPAPNPVRAPEDRLDSWKEIAAYLGRGLRTVQRWEREEGLPVHRLTHEKRAAYMREEKSWQRGGRAGDSRSALVRRPRGTRRPSRHASSG